MTKVICSEDCGNAPKKALLKEVHIAFAEHDTAFILENVTDDIRWHIIGDKLIQGKSEVAAALETMKDEKVEELTINNIITHGKTAAVNGSTTLASGRTVAFCDVYGFDGHGKNAKIKEITSYVIALVKED